MPKTTKSKVHISPDAISVADFIKRINVSLESHSGRIQGEVTSINNNYTSAIYFTLKDSVSDATLNCIIWRSSYDRNGIDLEVGDEIIVTGTPEIYPARGSFSLKAQTIEYAGEGALKKSYEELKKVLAEEGYFNPEKKRSLPKYPKKIGVITSKAGVVIQDFSSNLGRYGFDITMVDSRVEGKDAIHEILRAIKTLAKQDIEVLVVMRGGGSWESLQAFNTESVVRALADFKCPVLTGIGHDVDVTLSELVADVGASTPTAVAECLNESWDTLIGSLESAQSKVLRIFQSSILNTEKRLGQHSSYVKSVFNSIEKNILRANSSFQSIVSVMRSHIRAQQRHLQKVPDILKGILKNSISCIHADIRKNAHLMIGRQKLMVSNVSNSLTHIEKSIKLSDPMYNLRLGYTLSYINGKVVRSVKDIKPGDVIETKLADGCFTSDIKKVI